MISEFTRTNVYCKFNAVNGLILIVYSNDTHITLLYYEAELDVVKYKQQIPLKSIEMNIPVTPFTVKFSKTGKPIVFCSY